MLVFYIVCHESTSFDKHTILQRNPYITNPKCFYNTAIWACILKLFTVVINSAMLKASVFIEDKNLLTITKTLA